jgi:hypothetical protein
MQKQELNPRFSRTEARIESAVARENAEQVGRGQGHHVDIVVETRSDDENT